MKGPAAFVAGFERILAPRGAPARGRVFLVVLAGYALFAATYVPINRWSIGRAAHVLYLPGEARLPFVPTCEFLYGLTYVLPLLIVAWAPDARRVIQSALAFLLTLAVAFATYAVFPVYLERPVFEPTTLAKWLLALEYRDPSYNHFPSLHVALSWLVYLTCRERLPRRRAFMALIVAISLSTLFVKQHYFADVVYGALLAWAAWRLAARVMRRGRLESRTP
jgi:membrane-associated phospholipid phosphatase